MFDAIIPLGYSHQDYQTNAIELVSDTKNARLTGTTVHMGQHPKYSEFEKKLLLEILDRGADLEEEYKIKAGYDKANPLAEIEAKAAALKAEMMYKETMGVNRQSLQASKAQESNEQVSASTVEERLETQDTVEPITH